MQSLIICFQTEALAFRETMKERESWEYHLDALKSNAQAVVDKFYRNSASKGESKAITITKIGQNIQALEKHLISYETAITKIQKFKVETTKMLKFLGKERLNIFFLFMKMAAVILESNPVII